MKRIEIRSRFIFLMVFMMLFDVVCMVDFIVCSNCGLSYSTSENNSCSHCKFNKHEEPT